MRRVLIVDDDGAIRKLLRMALELDGLTVETAGDGLEALEVLSGATDTWVVLLDINMPRMTGLQVCARLSTMDGPLTRHLVVLMTAGLFPEGELPPLVQAMLAKPFNLPAVQELVARLTNVAEEANDANDATDTNDANDVNDQGDDDSSVEPAATTAASVPESRTA